MRFERRIRLSCGLSIVSAFHRFTVGRMDAVSSWPVIPALLAALVTVFLIGRVFGAAPEARRFASIDGLRGYLAVFVFLSHACIWYFHVRSQHWSLPPSHLYTHFGQSSVSLFFMITGLLFYTKLLDSRTKGLDFGRLFVSRVMRLVPLYVFAMGAGVCDCVGTLEGATARACRKPDSERGVAGWASPFWESRT